VRVRLATFNIENLGRRGGDALTIEARRPTLQAQLARLDADILCLQEINAQEAKPGPARRLTDLDAVLTGTAYAAFHHACTLRKSGVGPLDIHNLVTLSRWPIRHTRQLWNDLFEAPTYRRASGESATVPWDRPILQCDVDFGGRADASCHQPSSAGAARGVHCRRETAFRRMEVGPGLGRRRLHHGGERAGQGLEVRVAVDRIFDADAEALIAVAGDFNAATREVPVRIVRGDPMETGNPALAPRALVSLADAIGKDAFTVVHGERRFMLDHILASRALALACRKIAVDNAALLDDTETEALAARRPGSYHAPVVAEFELS
jgi:endonuclease/exonuclease/phosphatase family metal-dependent hydrolase